jgi:predicted lipoprotein with Yx(FWY)xxD motif
VRPTGQARGVTALAAVFLGLVVPSACGQESPSSSGRAPERESRDKQAAPPASTASRDAGTKVIVRPSQFGRMLFGANRQAIYVFERDRPGSSRCYGKCAKAWPPVLARGSPQAGSGVRRELLSTSRRRDGRTQVTYAGKPLYFYANERPGEVRCHNVDLNGGFWWVLGPNGRRRR